MLIRPYLQGEELAIWKLCQRAFLGFPWFEVMTDERIENRWKDLVSHCNFSCLVAEINGSIAGVSWYYEIADAELASAKGEELGNFVVAKFPLVNRIWIDATVIDPPFQGKGIATYLKANIIDRIRSDYPKVLILTRMRDDNAGIIHINEKLGFNRTGIKIPTGKDNLFHEYWYLAYQA